MTSPSHSLVQLFPHGLLAFAGLLSGAVGLHAEDADMKTPVPVFSFTASPSFEAQTSAGTVRAENGNLPELTDVREGVQAVRGQRNRAIVFPAPADFPREEGTLVMSFRLPDDFNPESKGQPYLFVANGGDTTAQIGRAHV